MVGNESWEDWKEMQAEPFEGLLNTTHKSLQQSFQENEGMFENCTVSFT